MYFEYKFFIRSVFFFKRFFYLFQRERERDRQTDRETETQAEGEAPCREPDVGLDPGSAGSRPGPKAVLNR